MFKVSSHYGVFESIIFVPNDSSNVNLNTDYSNSLNKLCLCHLWVGHTNKKHITTLQLEGIFVLFDLKSDDVYQYVLLGKTTKSLFLGTCERAERLLDLIHTDGCKAFKSSIRDGKYY